MNSTRIEGACTCHAIITDECRKNRTDWGAFHEAVNRLKYQYEEFVNQCGADRGFKAHLVLTIERPAPKIVNN